MVVNITVEDLLEPEKTDPCTDTPELPICGHAELVLVPSLLPETLSSFYVVESPLHT